MGSEEKQLLGFVATTQFKNETLQKPQKFMRTNTSD
jgi:hypothetical protein